MEAIDALTTLLAWVKRHATELRGSHFVNVRIRINGEWREYEADWLKQLARAYDKTTSK